MKPSKAVFVALLPLFAQVSPAQFVDWKGGTGTNLWSNADNWNPAGSPNTNGVDARFNINSDVQINVDGSFVVRSYRTGFAANGSNPANEHLLFGGTLTIDPNSASEVLGIGNLTNNDRKLRINCDIIIDNTLAGETLVSNGNGAANILEFDSNCDLTLLTKLRTNTNVGSIIFNCNFSPSAENLFINSNNVSFGPDHSSVNFGRDIVLFSNSKLAVDGGIVLTDFRKFQINGSGAELELNAADAVNNANIIIGGTNSLELDVNADQGTMGLINVNDGTLTIDIDPAVTNLVFKDSSSQAWGSGSITITGFKENTIRFGTDDTGLTAGQLAAIDGGAYSLTSSGFLTAGTPLLPSLKIALDPFPTITFLSNPGQTYQLQKSGDGALGAWADVVGQSVVGDGTEKTLSDPAGGPPGETRAFYRVETN